jgi:phosphoribosylanthranilate isomerase
MFRVKVCGVTSAADAAAAAACGADAVGINFWHGSKRYVAPEAAPAIAAAVAWKATAVALFVDAKEAEIRRACDRAGIGTVQLCGHEEPSLAAALPYRVIRSVAVRPGTDLSAWKDYPCDAFVFDAHEPGQYGGTGKSLDWDRLRRLVDGTAWLQRGGRPWMLAGGLDPDNVMRAIHRSGAPGVDVATGVESSPRKKEPALMARFVQYATEGFSLARED